MKLPQLRSFRRLPWLMAAIGLVLAQGAPLGLLLHSYAFGPALDSDFPSHVSRSLETQGSIYFYVWAGTSLFFSSFGWVLGLMLAVVQRDLSRLQSTLRLFSRFDSLRREFDMRVNMQIRNPGATAIEVAADLKKGLLGPLTAEQTALLESVLADLAGDYAQGTRALETARHGGGCSIDEILTRLSDGSLSIDNAGTSFPEVSVDPGLLLAALREISVELTSCGARSVKLKVHQTSPHTLALDFSTESALPEISSHGWTIARHILEWHGGALGPVEGDGRGIRVTLPLLAVPKEQAA